MNRFLTMTVLTIALALIGSQVMAEDLVSAVNVPTPGGDTVQFAMTIEPATAQQTIYLEQVSGGPAAKWTVQVVVLPDSNGDGRPEVSIQYLPAQGFDPFDVNQDGVVDGFDFLDMFRKVFYRQ